MGNLIESAVWAAGVPYFEADAILTGGPDCPDNIPIQALANRTAFLKKQLDDAVSGALTTMYANRLKTTRSIAMTGDGSWGVTFDGSGNVTAVMTLATTGVSAGEYKVVTVDSKGRVTGGRALQSSDLPTNPAFTGTASFGKLASSTKFAAESAAGEGGQFLLEKHAADANLSGDLVVDLTNGQLRFFDATTTKGAFINIYQMLAGVASRLLTDADLVSASLTGTPTTPTPAPGTNTKQIVNAEFVQTAIANLLNGAPGALDTLQELAAALGNDANFAATVTNALAGKFDKAGGALTGKLLAKMGAAAASNTNDAGYAFAGDNDTGMFSPTDGTLQLAVNGLVFMENIAGQALKFKKGIRAPKGAPSGGDANYATGYTFDDDGDTGWFAEGGSSVGGSDVVLRLDNTEVIRAKTTGAYLPGAPTTPTPALSDNSLRLANTAFVQQLIANLLNGAPGALDTLNELAAALGNDANFAANVTNALAGKAAKATTLAGYGITDAPTMDYIVGTPNLLPNPSFEDSAWGWTLGTGFTPSPGSFGEGSYVAGPVLAAADTRISYSDYIPIVANADLSLSLDMFSGGVTVGTIYADVEFYNASYTIIGKTGNVAATNGTQWKRYGGYLGKTPAGTVYCRVRLVVENAVNSNCAFRRVKLEGGRYPSAYSRDSAIPTKLAGFKHNDIMPVGVPVPWPLATPPSGWAICQGQTFNTTTYPLLATAYPGGTLPDLRGVHIVGYDGGRGLDTLSLGQYGADQMPAHSHSLVSRGVISGSSYLGQQFSTNDGASGTGYTGSTGSGSKVRVDRVAQNFIVRLA